MHCVSRFEHAMPKVSVITPCFNAARFVEQTIQSVAAQTLTDWELVVVDDGSTDASDAIVEAVCRREPRVRLLRQANRGVCAARNAGFRASDPDSQYLLFLDADDYLEPRMLEVLSGYLDAHPEAGVAFCDYSRIDESGQPLQAEPRIPRYVPWGVGMRKLAASEPRTPLEALVAGAPVLESLSLLRRATYQRTPGWSEALGQHHEGTELFVRMGLLSEVHFVPQTLYRYRRCSGQASENAEKQLRQSRRITEFLNNLSGIDPADQRKVRAAMRFYRYRSGPLNGVVAGLRHARHGHLLKAGRFFGGAAWRYAASFWPLDSSESS
jgi:GT2 family glycosyltransferase